MILRAKGRSGPNAVLLSSKGSSQGSSSTCLARLGQISVPGPVTAKLCETAIVFAGGAFCQKCWAPGLESSRFFAAGIVTIAIGEM